MEKIVLTNEIASSYLSGSVSESDYETLLNQPENYIKSQYDIDLNASLNIVKNQPDLINIALPYYSAIENMASSEISDEDLESVTGGEFLVSLGILLTMIGIGGFGMACLGGVMIANKVNKDKEEGKK